MMMYGETEAMVTDGGIERRRRMLGVEEVRWVKTSWFLRLFLLLPVSPSLLVSQVGIGLDPFVWTQTCIC